MKLLLYRAHNINKAYGKFGDKRAIVKTYRDYSGFYSVVPKAVIPRFAVDQYSLSNLCFLFLARAFKRGEMP